MRYFWKSVPWIFAALVLVLSTAPAAPTRAQSVFETCGGDIKTYCPAVTPGHGRIFACLYAHEDKISPSCEATLVDVVDILDFFCEAIRFTTQECREDIGRFCSSVEMGGGRMLSCLKTQGGKVSQACQGALEAIAIPK